MSRTTDFISHAPDELPDDSSRQQVKRPVFLIPACLKIGAHGLMFRVFIWIFFIQPVSFFCSSLSSLSAPLPMAFVLYAVTFFWPGVLFICRETKRLFSVLDYQQLRWINWLACVMSWLEEAAASLLLLPIGFMSFWMYCHAIIPYLLAGLIVGTFFPLCLLPRRFLGGEPSELDN